MLNGSNVWQKFNNLIMFPFRVAFDFLPFAHLAWMRVYTASCGMYTVEGAAEWNLFAREMKERECAFLYVWCHTTKPRSTVLRNSNTATDLECQVSFWHGWWLPLPSPSLLTPITNFQAEKVRQRDAGVDPSHHGEGRWGIDSLSIQRRPRHSCQWASTWLTPLNKWRNMITISEVAATLKTTIDYVCSPQHTHTWEITWT